jgi:SnoaL-like domain
MHLRNLAERYTAAWCSNDPARVAAFYSPGGSLTVNEGVAAIGREAIARVAQSFMTTFPDLRVVMDDLLEKDGGAEYHWTLTGTNNGHSVRISGMERWQIGPDGLITSSDGRFDSAEYQRQLQYFI